MKTIDDYMKLPYTLQIVEDPSEGGYVASYVELPGCLTCADTVKEVLELAEDAKRTWLESELEKDAAIPEPECMNKYSGQFKIRIPKSLHKTLVINAKREGISLNQYCVALLSQNNAFASMGNLNNK